MHEHFGVGFTFESVAEFNEGFFDGTVIFYDAIVHQGEPFIAGVMGVGVDVIGFTVGGPSCMTNTGTSFCIYEGSGRFKFCYFALFFDRFYMAIENADTSAVVPTVFQSFQSFEDDGKGLFFPNVCHNSTHDVSLGSSCKYSFFYSYIVQSAPGFEGDVIARYMPPSKL